MLPFDFNKILTYYHETQMIKNGFMPPPRMALIYPSYVCGHNCPGCHYKKWNEEYSENGFMDFHKFTGLLDELKRIGVEGIEFCGGGEPTCHPHFVSMLIEIDERKFKFGLFTNGERMTKMTADYLTKMASYVRLSIDDEAEWGALEKLVFWKKKNESKILIGAKVLVNWVNFINVESQIEKCCDMGVDYVQVKLEKPTSQNFHVPDMLKDKLKMNPKVVGSLVNISIEKRCWLTPIHTVIDVFGDVYLCCYFQFRKKKHKIGNCFEKSFKSIWGSARHWEAVKQIDCKECNVFDCRWMGYNKRMEDALKNGHLEFN